MNDEAIKQALECCFEWQCHKCPMLGKRSCKKSLRKHALDFINLLQERIEELEILTGLANSRKYYRKFVDEVFCKQKGNELSEPDFDYIYQLYFEQQAEIERLNGNLFTISNACMQRRNEAIKEFAEKVKNYVKTHCNPYGKPIFDYDTSLKILKYLDNLLAEMVGEQNA